MAHTVPLHDYLTEVETWLHAFGDEIHPVGRATIHGYLAEARAAAEDGNAAAVADWIKAISEKVALEREWSA